MTILATNVLVLNASYEPMALVSMKKAIKMLVREVAVVEESLEHTLGKFVLPKVLRLIRYVPMSWRYTKNPVCSKKAVLTRDRYVCGYCHGFADTMDHIQPKSKGGHVTWLNSIAACKTCNYRKGNRTPQQAGMKLLFEPTIPTVVELASRRQQHLKGDKN